MVGLLPSEGEEAGLLNWHSGAPPYHNPINGGSGLPAVALVSAVNRNKIGSKLQFASRDAITFGADDLGQVYLNKPHPFMIL